MSDESTRKKTGFFGRLFRMKEVGDPLEHPTEDAHADFSGHSEMTAEVSEAESAEGVAAETSSETPETARPAGWKRFFGGKDREEAQEEEAAEVEETGEEAAVAATAETKAGASPEEARRSWLRRLSDRLGRTRRGLVDNVRSAIGISGRLDEETIEEIEAILLQSDVSFETTDKIVRRMTAEAKSRPRDLSPDDMLAIFKDSIRDILKNSAPGFEPKAPQEGPYVVMVVGVNGVGKTTTIAKMAKRCRDAGLDVTLVAGDTFRAAAVEQLQLWSQRVGCRFVRGAKEADPASLCYDALQRSDVRESDVVFIDTAGRLHTKSSLMDELGKMERVIKKQVPDGPHETLLVLDATTGQNALQQVKIFSGAVKLNGLIMTKLDGTAKGGILLSVLDMYKIPITLIGVGEAADDLRDFDPDEFARGLFGEEASPVEA